MDHLKKKNEAHDNFKWGEYHMNKLIDALQETGQDALANKLIRIQTEYQDAYNLATEAHDDFMDEALESSRNNIGKALSAMAGYVEAKAKGE